MPSAKLAAVEETEIFFSGYSRLRPFGGSWSNGLRRWLQKIDGIWNYATTDEYKCTILNHVGADVDSMIVMKDGWAKDKNHIYFGGKARNRVLSR